MRGWKTFVLPLLAALRVSAHGYVSRVVIDGVVYAGNEPNDNTGSSPIRMISTIDPVKGANNLYLNCGQEAQAAAITAPAKPGSSVTFQWSGAPGGGDNWPHNVGPLMTYMTQCTTTNCAAFDSSSAEWFKIDELGMNSSNAWFQGYLTQGDSYTVTLPTSIKSGGYLIRHELIALHQAVSIGGAEFYPSCTQVLISGSGDGTPSSGEMCTFPGGYSDTDPGIYVPDIYNGGLDYVFPGPNLSHLASAGDGMITAKVPGGDAPPTGSTIATSTASVPVVAVPSGAGGSSGSSSPDSGSGSGSGDSSGTSVAAMPTAGAGSAAAPSPPKCALKSSVAQTPLSTLSRRRLHHVIRRFFSRSS
ncbi:glycosyl hydrolase family 61-domain-containing protein [Fomitopsis serialis]|uniref:glycosyl hydrolase family 61-domain-containing protein n=1 Tax=Fomitopsis serialis TaxID=139415 RepID=UPI0020080750|nr:glycosyl hydrolase family 61-domain-containing protein [Neoantrodia serialis]KAH9931329.1 glycosyl hydrolase family 61-domain-containing protein [Neoantrodia serialis]